MRIIFSIMALLAINALVIAPVSANVITSFNETGLPIGSGWSVSYNSIVNSSLVLSSQSFVNFSTPSGTYNFTIPNVTINNALYYASLTATGALSAGSQFNVIFLPYTVSSFKTPNGVYAYSNITISNARLSATLRNFQEPVLVQSFVYNAYEASNLQNVEFFYNNGTIIPSWIESGNSNTSSNTLYWLGIAPSIPANSALHISIGFAPRTTNLFNNVNVGEAANLSPQYGQYDDGKSVFYLYDNFAGQTLNSTLWTSAGGNIIVNNGLTMGNSVVLNNVATVASSYSVSNPLDMYMTGFATNAANHEFLAGYNAITALAGSLSLYVKMGTSGAYSISQDVWGSSTIRTAIFTSQSNQIFSVWSNATTAFATNSLIGGYFNAKLYKSSGDPFVNANTGIELVGNANNNKARNAPQNANAHIYWIRTRAPLPSNIAPTSSFAAVQLSSLPYLYTTTNVLLSGAPETVYAGFRIGADSSSFLVNGQTMNSAANGIAPYTFEENVDGTYNLTVIDTNGLSLSYGGRTTKFLSIYSTLGLSVNTANSINSNTYTANAFSNPNTDAIQILFNGALQCTVTGTASCVFAANVPGVNNVTAFDTNALIKTSNIYYASPISKIKHVVIIFQENHAFDNYFGTYPGVLGLNSIGYNSVCNPILLARPSLGCISPWLDTNPVDVGATHYWSSSHLAYNNGSMNGFAQLGGKTSMGYYDNHTIPYYWAWAKHYTLLDHLFSSVLSYSLPNHWYEIAANAPNLSYYRPGNCQQKVGVGNGNYLYCMGETALGAQYIQEAQPINTLADELIAANVSWKYYAAETVKPDLNSAIQTGQAFSLWDPLLSQNRTYSGNYIGHYVQTVQIFNDIANGTLPAVSWISPPTGISEHPAANIIIGSWYVSNIIDSIELSKYWNSTAIIVTWDDFGGYYDGVKPPQIDGYGLSFRVPGIIISPYAKQNYIDHTNYSFESTMAYIETLYGLAPLQYRDSNALPLLYSFDYTQAPQKPYIIPLNKTQIYLVKSFLTPNNIGLSPNDNFNYTGDGSDLAYSIPNSCQSLNLAPTSYAGLTPSQNLTASADAGNLTISTGYTVNASGGIQLTDNYSFPSSWFNT